LIFDGQGQARLHLKSKPLGPTNGVQFSVRGFVLEISTGLVAIVSNTPSTDADCNLDFLREESKLQSEKRGYAPWIAAAFYKGR
jgi:hypothetical protein